MSLAEMITAQHDAGPKSRTDAALNTYPTGESAGDTARRLAASSLVLDCETTGFGRGARIWDLAVVECGDLSPLTPLGDLSPTLTTAAGDKSPESKSGDKSPHSILFNPGQLAPSGGQSQYEWERVPYEMAVEATNPAPIPPGNNLIGWLAMHPPFRDKAEAVISLLAGRAVVGWNVEFDQRMLQQEFARVGFSQFSQRFQTIRWMDVMGLYIAWRKERNMPFFTPSGTGSLSRVEYPARYKLEFACAEESIDPEKTHRAESGARCCVELLRRMAGPPRGR